MIRVILLGLLLAVTALSASAAIAHEVRPALLEVVRSANSVCRVQWKQPMAGNAGLPLHPQLTDGWTSTAPERLARTAAHYTSYWTHEPCGLADLERQNVQIVGLDGTITDVLIRIDYGDGDLRQHMLRPGDPPLSLARKQPAQNPATAYFGLGIEHILEGIDHLAFVLGLVLIVGLNRRLVAVVTCFTLAHSLTLGLTALGVVAPPPALVEALVALSIVFVAVEALRARRGGSSLTIRYPEMIALTFGLLHGFAFAGALAEIGLPKAEKLPALLLFNLGVEAGQLLFIAALWLLALVGSRLRTPMPRWTAPAPAYMIGILASFWLFERITTAFKMI